MDPNKIVLGGFDEESGYKGFKELIARGEKPEVFFGAPLPIILGAYASMRKVNPAYIDEIKVLSFHDETRMLGLNPYPQYNQYNQYYQYYQYYVVQPAI